MTPEQLAKFAALITLRNTEATLRWTRSQLFIFIHSAGLTLAVTQRQLGPVFLFLAGGVGIALMVLWILITVRANQWLTFWHAQLSAAESAPPEQEIIIFGSDAYTRVARSHLTINRILVGLMIIFVLFWAVVILLAFL